MVILKTFFKRKQVASPFVFEVDEQTIDEISKINAVSIKNFNSNKNFIKLQIAMVLVIDMLMKFIELDGLFDSKIEILFMLCKETMMRLEKLQ